MLVDADAGRFVGRQIEAREEHESALGALEALIVELMAPMTTPETFANHLAFLCIDLTDPQFRQHALAIHHSQGRAIETLLAESVSKGELRAGTDVAALARSVQAITSGAGLIWALDRQGTLAQRLGDQVNSLLSPHTTTSPDHDLEES